MNTLKPFKRFCITLGEIPSSYLESMSYYETLVWLCNYLNKIIEPSLKETQEGVTELQEFVSHYFDNLNVQEEINNKLDEMADSGELTDIIAQYLNLAGMLVFSNIEDLKNATNLANGSTCETLGYNDLYDAKGGVYKIRTLTSSDVIDGINIIKLNNYPTLIAELLPRNTIAKNFYLGAFHYKYSESDKRTYLFLSDDAENWNKIDGVELIGNGTCSEPSILYNENNKTYYLAYSNQQNGLSFGLYTSKDLKIWTHHGITLNLPSVIQGYNKWAPDLFFDKNGDMYVTLTADKTQNGFDFEILIAKCNDIENLTFDEAYIINKDVDYIIYDSCIKYYAKLDKYIMSCTNKDNNRCEIFISDDLQTFNIKNINAFRIYNTSTFDTVHEGSQINIINNEIYVISEMHDKGIFIRTHLSNDGDYNNLGNDVMPSLNGYKHGSFIEINNSLEKNKINKLNCVPMKTIVNSNKRLIETLTLNEDTTINDFTIIPGMQLMVYGNYNLTLHNVIDPFHCGQFDYVYAGTGTLTLDGVEGDYSQTKTLKHNIYNANKLVNVSIHSAFNNNLYNEGEDITSQIQYTTDFNNNFNIINSRWYKKDDVIYYYLLVQTKTTLVILNDAIILPAYAQVGCQNTNATEDLANVILTAISPNVNSMNINFKGGNGAYMVTSGSILIKK